MSRPPDSSHSAADALFARARSGDQDAWDELFHTCHPKLVRAVRRRLSTPLRSLYDSTDFAGDVWKSLVAKADRFDFPTLGHLLSFLAKAAEQKVIDEHRRLHARKNDVGRDRPMELATADGAEPRALASPDPTPSKVAVAGEVLELLRDGCSEVEREVIDLRLRNYPNAEIAPRVGWDLRKVQRFLKDLSDSWASPAGGRR